MRKTPNARLKKPLLPAKARWKKARTTATVLVRAEDILCQTSFSRRGVVGRPLLDNNWISICFGFFYLSVVLPVVLLCGADRAF
jgi:hypothetical protein